LEVFEDFGGYFDGFVHSDGKGRAVEVLFFDEFAGDVVEIQMGLFSVVQHVAKRQDVDFEVFSDRFVVLGGVL
jgi:hypothetical protein